MSDEDRIKIAGRAVLKLKELRADIARLTVEVRRRNQELSDVSSLIGQLIADPGRRDPSMLQPRAASIAQQLHQLDLASLGAQIQELFGA
jgi:hypothetical protein